MAYYNKRTEKRSNKKKAHGGLVQEKPQEFPGVLSPEEFYRQHLILPARRSDKCRGLPQRSHLKVHGILLNQSLKQARSTPTDLEDTASSPMEAKLMVQFRRGRIKQVFTVNHIVTSYVPWSRASAAFASGGTFQGLRGCRCLSQVQRASPFLRCAGLEPPSA